MFYTHPERKIGMFAFLDAAMAHAMSPAPVVAPVRTAEQVRDLRNATVTRPTERRISEHVLKEWTVEKMATKLFDLALKRELALRAGRDEEVKTLDKKVKHYEVICEAKELLEPGFQVKVTKLVEARGERIIRSANGTIHRMEGMLAHAMDGGQANVGEQPEPLMDEELKDAFSQIADPALVDALNALSQTAQQGGQSTL